MDSGCSMFILLPDCETMRQRDNGFYKYHTQYNIQYKSFRNALSRCHTVTRRIDGLVSTLPTYEESIGQYRSDNGVVTGKTAEKQDKCNNPHNRDYLIRLCGFTISLKLYRYISIAAMDNRYWAI